MYVSRHHHNNRLKLKKALKTLLESGKMDEFKLIVQNLGYLIRYDEDEDENEWISEWGWDNNKLYRVLDNGISFIVFCHM